MFFTRGNVFRVASSIKSSSICKHCFIVRRSFSVQSQTAPTGPLTGIKVLDMSRILAGPYATMLLGIFCLSYTMLNVITLSLSLSPSL